MIRKARIQPPIILLIFAVFFAAACTSASPPTPAATTLPPTPIGTVSPLTNPTPIVTRSDTKTDPPPTTVPTIKVVETDMNQDNSNEMEANRMNITIGDRELTATLVENSSVDALKETLLEGPITIDMRDYGSMEKVGSLGMDLPRNDQEITTEAGDIILYQGNALVIYYAPNSWNFTRLGRIDNVTAHELREILGDGDVTITLSLSQD